MSRKTIVLGLALLMTAALARYLFVERMRYLGGPPRTTHDYIAVSARITVGMPYREVVALLGKPTRDVVTPGAGVDPSKLTPAQFRALRLRYTDWYIGKEGEGAFWPTIRLSGEAQRQQFDAVFDRDDRLMSKSIYTEGQYLYDD